MAAYAVSMRIEPVRPRRADPVAHDRGVHRSLGDGRPAILIEDLTGGTVGDRVAGWGRMLAEEWAQATFFLFDPESWR